MGRRLPKGTNFLNLHYGFLTFGFSSLQLSSSYPLSPYFLLHTPIYRPITPLPSSPPPSFRRLLLIRTFPTFPYLLVLPFCPPSPIPPPFSLFFPVPVSLLALPLPPPLVFPLPPFPSPSSSISPFFPLPTPPSSSFCPPQHTSLSRSAPLSVHYPKNSVPLSCSIWGPARATYALSAPYPRPFPSPLCSCSPPPTPCQFPYLALESATRCLFLYPLRSRFVAGLLCSHLSVECLCFSYSSVLRCYGVPPRGHLLVSTIRLCQRSAHSPASCPHTYSLSRLV